MTPLKVELRPAAAELAAIFEYVLEISKSLPTNEPT